MKRPASLKRMARKMRGRAGLRLRKGETRDVRTQFAALCWRRNKRGKLRICLVTSRRTRRWILPKGWPMPDVLPAQAAAIEAWEEAGVAGFVTDRCLGVYADRKELPKRRLPVMVMVYPLAVTESYDDWPERRERERVWLSRKKAARRLQDPVLSRMVRRFEPEADA